MKYIIFSFLVFLISAQSFGQNDMYDICPVKVSQEIPDAKVFNPKGKEISLKKYIGDKPAVLVFYRGGWCPYCTRHLSALQEVKTQIDSLGYELIAITPDDFSKLDSSIIRGKGVDYTLLSDKNINAINAFGIGWKLSDELYNKYKNKYNLDLEWWSGSKHHVLPVPAVFVIKKGKIQYSYVNPDYSQRLSPNVLLSFLKD